MLEIILHQILSTEEQLGDEADAGGEDRATGQGEVHTGEPGVDGRHSRDHHKHQHPAEKGQENGQP